MGFEKTADIINLLLPTENVGGQSFDKRLHKSTAFGSGFVLSGQKIKTFMGAQIKAYQYFSTSVILRQ